jgi:hypothetical protein
LSAAQLGLCIAAGLIAVACFETIKLAGNRLARKTRVAARPRSV